MATIPSEVIAAAAASQRKWNIPARVCLAQWALESGWGAHQPGNNPFGIKARPGESSISLMTWEVIGGRNQRMPQDFRRFASLADAFDAHGSLLAQGAAYAAARAVRHDPDAFARALTGHYATDPHYGDKLVALMRSMPDVATPTDPGVVPERTTIADAQRSLNRLGAHPALAVDGDLGPRTRAALRRFQAAHGLDPDGHPEHTTLAALASPRRG